MNVAALVSADPSVEVDAMLRLSRAQANDAVSVVGPHAIDIVLELHRRGFTRVTCFAGDAATCGTEPGDHLFVSGPVPDARLEAVIAHVAGLLVSDGVLVARLTTVDQNRRLEACLAGQGLEVRSTVYDLSFDVLVAHRLARPAASLAIAA